MSFPLPFMYISCYCWLSIHHLPPIHIYFLLLLTFHSPFFQWLLSFLQVCLNLFLTLQRVITYCTKNIVNRHVCPILSVDISCLSLAITKKKGFRTSLVSIMTYTIWRGKKTMPNTLSIFMSIHRRYKQEGIQNRSLILSYILNPSIIPTAYRIAVPPSLYISCTLARILLRLTSACNIAIPLSPWKLSS